MKQMLKSAEMRKVSLILLIMMTRIPVLAQSTQTDSVAKEKKVEILLQLVQKNMDTNIPMAVFQAESALELAFRTQNQNAIASAAYYLGTLYGTKMSNPKKGIYYYEQSVNAIGEKNDVTYLADVHFNLATLYATTGFYNKALDHLSICFDVYQERKDILNGYFVRVFMTSLYSEYSLGPFSKVREDFLELLKIARKVKNDSLFIVTASCYTTALIAHREFQEAELYANQALKIIGTNDHYAKFKQTLYLDLGDVFFHDRLLNAAINQYETAKEISIRLKMNEGLYESLLRLGQAYDQLGEDKLAREHYRDALRGFDNLNMIVKSVEVCEAMSSFEYRQKNLTEAFGYRSRQLGLKDSLIRRQSMAILDYRNSMLIKKGLLEQQHESINWLLINLILIVLLGVCFMGLLYLNKKRLFDSKNRSMLVNEKIILEKELENQRLGQEKLNLQLELNAKALTVNSLNIIEKNEILLQIKEKILATRSSSADGSQMNSKDLTHLVNFALNIDKDWDNFKLHFEQVHNGFFDELKSKYPNLNSSDLKLCALLKLNLDTKGIASIMNISAASVKVARSRLRKKLELDMSSNLSAFITQI